MDPLLDKVYAPDGSVGYYGFNGGGPASDAQKRYLRHLLAQHAGDPTAESIRAYLNCRRSDPETTVTVSDVAPAIAWLKRQ